MCAYAVFILAAMLVLGAEADSGKKTAPNTGTDGNMAFLDDEMVKMMKTCNESFNIPQAYLKELNETGRLPEKADRNSKCYIYCVMEQMGIVDTSGRVNQNNAVNWFVNKQEQKGMEESIRKCDDNKQSDKCEQAYQFISCVIMNDPSRADSKDSKNSKNSKNSQTGK